MKQNIIYALTLIVILFLSLTTGCVCNNNTRPSGAIADAEIHVINPPDGRVIQVKFYLETLKFEKKNKFTETSIPGSKPILQFINNELSVLSMTLFFDSSEAGIDVRELTENVLSLMDVDQAIHAPPVLSFRWRGGEFKCVLDSAVEEFLILFPDGRPSRAIIDVSFREFFTLNGN
jgi:hypothetical protein